MSTPTNSQQWLQFVRGPEFFDGIPVGSDATPREAWRHSWSMARSGEEHMPGRFNDLAAWLLGANEEPGGSLDETINRRGYAPREHRDTCREIAYWPRAARPYVAEGLEADARDAYGDWYTNDGVFGA